MTVIGVVLAIIGPFGSIGDPLAVRLMVWLGYAYLGYALYRPIDTLAGRLEPVVGMPKWWLTVVACLVATVPMASFIYVIGFAGRDIVWPSASYALAHYLNVLVIGAGVTAIFYIMGRSGNALEEPPASATPQSDTASAPPQPRLLDRLPAALGSDIRALEMEDHYVRVHTALGSEMVLMRLGDAIAEVDGIEGLRVHRSWWVARGAVEDVVREGRNIRLVLGGGLEAPVSRANVSVLKDAGWI